MARILLADDEAATRDFVKRALEADQHVVVTASDGGEAQATLAAAPQSFDLLVTDVEMPGVDGFTLVRHAATLRKGLPVLMMSGFAVDRERLAATGANVVGLIQKPFTLEQIKAHVKLALRAG